MPNEPVTFVVFAGDLVTFALKKILQVNWKLTYQLATHRKTFHETIGEAVLVFHDRHTDEFAGMIADFPMPVAADAESAVEYLENFVGSHFKGRVPLMELLVYFAFVVDLCVCCAENGKTDLIADIVCETYDVYLDHVKSYFEIVGGWLALLNISRDYLGFVESMRKYSVLVATDSENEGNKHAIHSTKSRKIAVNEINSIASTSSENNSETSTMTTNIINFENEVDRFVTNFIHPDTDNIQPTAAGTSSTETEDLNTDSSTSICCLENYCDCGSSNANAITCKTYSQGTPSTISSALSDNTIEKVEDVLTTNVNTRSVVTKEHDKKSQI